MQLVAEFPLRFSQQKNGYLSAHWWCCWIDLSMVQNHTRMKMYEELVIVRYIFGYGWKPAILFPHGCVKVYEHPSIYITIREFTNGHGNGVACLPWSSRDMQVEHWQSKLYVWATSNLNFTPEGILCLVGFGSWYLRRFTVPTVGQSWRCVGSPRLIRTWNSPQRETLCVKILGVTPRTQVVDSFIFVSTIYLDTW
jgi:hypothetical protein